MTLFEIFNSVNFFSIRLMPKKYQRGEGNYNWASIIPLSLSLYYKSKDSFEKQGMLFAFRSFLIEWNSWVARMEEEERRKMNYADQSNLTCRLKSPSSCVETASLFRTELIILRDESKFSSGTLLPFDASSKKPTFPREISPFEPSRWMSK